MLGGKIASFFEQLPSLFVFAMSGILSGNGDQKLHARTVVSAAFPPNNTFRYIEYVIDGERLP